MRFVMMKGMVMVFAGVAVMPLMAETDYSWEYRIEGDGAVICGGSYYMDPYDDEPKIFPTISPRPSGAVTIPATLGGKPVTVIGEYSFGAGCNGMTSVTIPASVIGIDCTAFNNCRGLKEVYISDLAAWCRIDFTLCHSDYLGGESNPLVYADGLYLNGSLITDLTIPASVTEIGNKAFLGYCNLMSVTIPSSVVRIGSSAFRGCSGLTSVTIGDSVMRIGDSAFCGCNNLTSVTIPDGLTSIEDMVFYNCSSFTSVTIPDGVTNIGNYAFAGCSRLTSVMIPNSVTSIESGAFFGCSGLTSVTIPDSVTSIGDHAFSGCTNLTSITIHAGVTNIGDNAFANCKSLTSVTIPQYVLDRQIRNIFSSGFLTNVSYSSVITSIGAFAFSGCSGLTGVAIPDSVTRISESAFLGCSDLLYDTTTIRGVKLVDGWAVGNTGAISGDLDLSGVRGIGDGAFKDCRNLMSVNIPDNVTSIGDFTFSGCTSLEGVTIPDGVTSLSSTAFDGCDKLWTAWYKTLINQSCLPSVITSTVERVSAPYSLTNSVADRAIASVTVDGDCAIDEFVLRDGKVYDCVLYIDNTANHSVKLTLPAGNVYKAFKGVKPLEIPEKSQHVITITRVDDKTFLVSREELETLQ